MQVQSLSPCLSRCVTIAALAIAAAVSVGLEVVDAQTTYTYSGGAGDTWLNSAHWTGTANKYPGVDANASSTADGATTDIAAIGAIGSTTTATTVDINFGSSLNSGVNSSTAANTSLTLGTIDFLVTDNRAISIRNSSTTVDGTLTLGGDTLNAIANTILANEGSQNAGLTNGTSRRMDLALGNATTNVVQVNGSGNVTITSLIKDGTGTSNLTLTSTGTPSGQLILNGVTPNTFSGTTTVNKGTMNLVTAGSLGSTSGITVNTGGTLLLSGSANLDRINSTATMTLSGGTFNTGGLSEHGVSNNTAGIGAVTLSANSILDLASGASIIAFANSSASPWTAATKLSIYNWSGTLTTGGGTDQVYFGTDATGLTTTQLSQIEFYSGSGTGDLGSAMILSTGEIVPVPEPGTWGAAVLTAAVIGHQLLGIRRRRSRSMQAA